MLEERFDRIEQALGRLESGQGDMGKRLTDVVQTLGRLESGQGEMGTRLTDVEQALGHPQSGQREMSTRLTDLDRKVDVLHQDAMMRIAEVDRHMHVLHEEAIDRIKGIADAVTVVDAKIDRRAAELKEAIGRHLDRLETLGSDHEGRILGLEGGRR